MTSPFAWEHQYVLPFIFILLTSFCFSIYWFLSVNKKIETFFFSKYDKDKAWLNYVVFQKLTGFFFLGIIPAIVILSISDYSLTSLGMNLKNLNQSLLYILIIGGLFLVVNYFNTKKKTSLSVYPQMRINRWAKKEILINSLAWTAYLFSYEFLFRGILLITCVDTFGFWPAVAINLSLYSTTHIPKGLTETLSTFPYGLILCLITISTGSFLVAFITHLILALSNDYFSIHHNPEFQFV